MTATNNTGERTDEELRGAVVAGLIPGQDRRVVTEAARFAKLFGVPLVVVTVAMPRYVGFEDPSGILAGAAPELMQAASEADIAAVELEASEALVGQGVQWTLRSVNGEPSRAIGELADAVRASLIVVGTRKPGFGETLREFFNGSVAARLSHNQRRSVLVVPNGEVQDAADLVVEGDPQL